MNKKLLTLLAFLVMVITVSQLNAQYASCTPNPAATDQKVTVK
jgi:hypothetical protein